MKPRFRVQSFQAYEATVAARLVPLISQNVLGIEVRLSARRQHVDVVLFRAAAAPAPDEASLAPLRAVVAPLLVQFDDLSTYTTHLLAEACEPERPPAYHGVPVWERTGVQWQLAADREPSLLVRAG